MNMDTAAEVLLIIVSSVLALFLILLSIAAIYTIRTLKTINKMADRAEEVASRVESAADALRNTATAVPLVKVISNLLSWSNRRKKGK